MAKAMKLGGSSDFWTAVTVVGTTLLIGAALVKALSPDHKCPNCDRIITALQVANQICPTCGFIGLLKV